MFRRQACNVLACATYQFLMQVQDLLAAEFHSQALERARRTQSGSFLRNRATSPVKRENTSLPRDGVARSDRSCVVARRMNIFIGRSAMLAPLWLQREHRPWFRRSRRFLRLDRCRD
jgi:hypothetical protein